MRNFSDVQTRNMMCIFKTTNSLNFRSDVLQKLSKIAALQSASHVSKCNLKLINCSALLHIKDFYISPSECSSDSFELCDPDYW